MKIEKLQKILKIKNQILNNNEEIANIQFDSRKISKNDLFIAISGTKDNGHDFINNAISNGASSIVCEIVPKDINSSINYFCVEDSAKALGFLASEFYGNPSQKLKLIGITGTNGKTTIATSLFNVFRLLGCKTGLLSTICVKIENKEFPATHTTPDPLQLNYYLSLMIEAGCKFCFIEVSSHAIAQQRIAGLTFEGGVFTNITHEHLDFHKTFTDYIKTKQLFFTNLSENSFALTNSDDKNGEVMFQNSNANKYTYSLKSNSNFKVKILENHFDGMLINLDNTEIWTHFTGKFNAYNLIAIYSVSVLCGFSKEAVLPAISAIKPVEGRFDIVKSEKGFFAIIDYAHTPDALQNVITTINEIRAEKGILITVVGCGGDRDKTKRPEMAVIAADLSDKVILTSDNPRTEDPEKILNDMQNGLNQIQNNKTLRITNRAEAIRTACMLATKDDIILVAGKGHEKYQEINGVKNHFDDKEIILKCFN
ncbi:MAG: UDP-N-acetylmuramoyl-L-alanyl-D-glutamate--2,6-diaminopimelate ligase [Bacteroidales bacterium]|jgi:UDP-N-acetylmuramoyl-L-alanyl-D-glutamate--2,6-diaminopimelate ligase|nr:UDP-N-acetylmuramoyl-L-alanyl-D-glutamate--2,6-diaminopimelate ligase [Bacteroidales bacterium]